MCKDYRVKTYYSRDTMTFFAETYIDDGLICKIEARELKDATDIAARITNKIVGDNKYKKK